jgi:large subunit ribosomal protein L21
MIMAQKHAKTESMDRYAIIQTGGKQYQALEGKTLGIEKLNVEVGGSVKFDQVLLRKIDENVEIGKPYVKTPVLATVVKHMRGPKLIVFKFKRRKKHTRKQGHRQPITVVRIQSI